MLTFDEFNKIEANSIFARGEIENSPEGIYMTDTSIGHMLKWIAKKGDANDWCIYCEWAISDWKYVATSGQKVYEKHNILKLVPCDKEVMDHYRK